MTKTQATLAATTHLRRLLTNEETKRALSGMSDQRLADIGVETSEVRDGASMTVQAGLMPSLMALQ